MNMGRKRLRWRLDLALLSAVLLAGCADGRPLVTAPLVQAL